MTSDAPTEARKKLDKAIREYCRECDTDQDELGAFLPTGWVMIVAGVRPSFKNDDGASYISESMPGQPWHAALGLWAYGHDRIRFNSESRRPDDD